MSEWISVKDRLPEAGEMVLVNVDRYSPSVTVGELDCGKWALVCNIGTINDIDYESNPTHWMPLPEPPEPQLRVKEALREAVDLLENVLACGGNGTSDGGWMMGKQDRESIFCGTSTLLPRLRAALEAE